MRILVVEDDPDTLEAFEMVLAEFGDVVGVGARDAAMGALRDTAFDLAVVDVVLDGEARGVDIVALAGERLVPVVAISALSRLEIERTLGSVRADVVASKPFEIDAMLGLAGGLARQYAELNGVEARVPSEALSWQRRGPGIEVAYLEQTGGREAFWVRVVPGARQLERLHQRAGIVSVHCGELRINGTTRRAGERSFVGPGCVHRAFSASGCEYLCLQAGAQA